MSSSVGRNSLIMASGTAASSRPNGQFIEVADPLASETYHPNDKNAHDAQSHARNLPRCATRSNGNRQGHVVDEPIVTRRRTGG